MELWIGIHTRTLPLGRAMNGYSFKLLNKLGVRILTQDMKREVKVEKKQKIS